jgi:hypothetical protein
VYKYSLPVNRFYRVTVNNLKFYQWRWIRSDLETLWSSLLGNFNGSCNFAAHIYVPRWWQKKVVSGFVPCRGIMCLARIPFRLYLRACLTLYNVFMISWVTRRFQTLSATTPTTFLSEVSFIFLSLHQLRLTTLPILPCHLTSTIMATCGSQARRAARSVSLLAIRCLLVF